MRCHKQGSVDGNGYKRDSRGLTGARSHYPFPVFLLQPRAEMSNATVERVCYHRCAALG